ncbi:MAG: HlyD family secretion protein [Alphaproteobacteria bacterium]|nr:HlyD family secretion protein [Alphaproteobacteria bacterium]
MPYDRDPGLQGADVLEAPAQARGAPERRRAPTDRRPAPVAPLREQQGPQAERPAAEEQPISRRRRWLRWALFALLPVVLIVGAYFYFKGGAYMTTDDAYVEADQVGLSTDVSGMVQSVDVKDNQQVTKGQVLFQLDPAPFQLKLDQAQAQLGVVADNFRALKQNYQSVEAQIVQAQDQVTFNQRQYERQAILATKGFAAQAAVDQARVNLQNAEQSLASLKHQLAGIVANLGGNPNIALDQYPTYRQALAARNEDARELHDTVVRAPFPGTVTHVDALRPGMYLTASTTGFYLVDTHRVWVEAQPKETELTYVRAGQPATITVDTYPGHTWHGKVASLGPAAASQFSLLPAENTSGNWVKVVQRIPMRVAINGASLRDNPPLRAGMSAEVSVHTGHKRGLPHFLTGLFGGGSGGNGANSGSPMPNPANAPPTSGKGPGPTTNGKAAHPPLSSSNGAGRPEASR